MHRTILSRYLVRCLDSEGTSMATKRPLKRVPQTAERLGVSVRKVWSLISSGELPAVYIGHSTRIDPDDEDMYIESRRRKRGKDDAVTNEQRGAGAT